VNTTSFTKKAIVILVHAFIGFVILMDFFVIAIFVEKSFAMFGSLLGTWIPFGLIFAATYLVG
jgi:hypothetical protein